MRWRIFEASNIIRSVKVEITLPDDEVVRVRAFLPTHGRESEGGRAWDYSPVESLSEVAMHRIEDEMQRHLQRLRTKYAEHAHLFAELLAKTAKKTRRRKASSDSLDAAPLRLGLDPWGVLPVSRQARSGRAGQG